MYRSAVVFLLLIAPPFTYAQSDPGNFEITPYGAYSFGGTFTDDLDGSNVELDDSASFGLILNMRQAANTQWELIYSQQSTSAQIRDTAGMSTPVDMKMTYLQGGGTYQGDGDVFRPYLAATVGATFVDVTTDGYNSDTFFSFSIGPGLQIRPNDRLGFRVEIRGFGTLVQSGSSLFCVSNPGGGTAGCAVNLAGDVLWQLQTSAGVVFRF